MQEVLSFYNMPPGKELVIFVKEGPELKEGMVRVRSNKREDTD